MKKTEQRKVIGIARAARDQSCRMAGGRAALLALVLAACSAAEEPPSRELYELERLSFVPPARCELASFDLSLATAIVIDRYEFTRADLAYYWPDHERRAAGVHWPGDVA